MFGPERGLQRKGFFAVGLFLCRARDCGRLGLAVFCRTGKRLHARLYCRRRPYRCRFKEVAATERPPSLYGSYVGSRAPVFGISEILAWTPTYECVSGCRPHPTEGQSTRCAKALTHLEVHFLARGYKSNVAVFWRRAISTLHARNPSRGRERILSASCEHFIPVDRSFRPLVRTKA